VSAGIDLYHRITDETTSNFYGSTATGGQLRFGAPITRDLSASVFVGGETKTFEDDDTPFSSFGPTGTPDGSLHGVVKNKAWIGYSLVYNTLDDVKRPTEGFYATLTQRYTGW